jgi:hypothetical protein
MKIMSVVDKRKISVAPCAHRAAKTPCLIAEAARRQRALRIIQQRSQNGVGDPFQNYAVVGRDPDQKAGNRGISQAEEFGSFGMPPPRQRYTVRRGGQTETATSLQSPDHPAAQQREPSRHVRGEGSG